MGNRAVITANADLKGTGVYLHWNGGRDSVEGFLAFCKMKGYRSPDDDNYGWACLACVICNYFGDGLSYGVDNCEHLDCNNWDNGVYIVKDWNIVGRKYSCGAEQLEYDLKTMVEHINDAQPPKLKLTKDEWAKFDGIKEEILEHRG